MKSRKYGGCGAHAWPSTGLQLTHRNFEGSRHSSALLGAFECPRLARTPVVAELADTRELVLRQVDKRIPAPVAHCRAAATNAMSTTPDAVPTSRRTDQGAILHHFAGVAPWAKNPFHAMPLLFLCSVTRTTELLGRCWLHRCYCRSSGGSSAWRCSSSAMRCMASGTTSIAIALSAGVSNTASTSGPDRTLSVARCEPSITA